LSSARSFFSAQVSGTCFTHTTMLRSLMPTWASCLIGPVRPVPRVCCASQMHHDGPGAAAAPAVKLALPPRARRTSPSDRRSSVRTAGEVLALDARPCPDRRRARRRSPPCGAQRVRRPPRRRDARRGPA
jgi:hypothetical protein